VLETLGRQVVASEQYPRLPVSDVLGCQFTVPLRGGLELLRKSVTGAEELGFTEKYAFVPPRRPLTLLDIIPRTPIIANSVLYVQQTSFTYIAVPVAHGARKPEAAATYTQQTATVTTIATWIPVTNPMLADGVGLETSLDVQLVDALNVELQAQLIAGDGVLPDLLGILNVPGISTYTRSGESVFNAARKAATLTILTGQVMPTALVIHPTDLESLELGGGGFPGGSTGSTFGGGTFGGSSPTLLGAFNLLTQIPIIQTTAIGQGTALIGAFDVGCMLFDRQRGRVTRGTIDDNFQRNIQVVRAELEAAFAVLRPAAFTKIVL